MNMLFMEIANAIRKNQKNVLEKNNGVNSRNKLKTNYLVALQKQVKFS